MKEKSLVQLYLVTFLIIVGGSLFSCTNYAMDNNSTPTIVKSYQLSEPGNLLAITSGGSITVSGSDTKEIEINVFIRKNGIVLSSDDPLVKSINDGFEIVIEKNENTITVSAKRTINEMPWKKTSISYAIKVPTDMTCTLNTSGGSLKLTGVNGEQTLKTSGGSIKLATINGNVKAHTSGGSIKANMIIGVADLYTSGGSISLIDSKGNIEAYTSGGSIKIENSKGDVIAKTSGGSITINGYAEALTAKTSGGGIRANITGLSKSLTLATSGGSIKATIPENQGLTLDLAGNGVNIDLQNFDGTAKKSKVKGTINGGGIPVTMKTSGGGVSVSFN